MEAHRPTCFQLVQDDMSKTHSVNKDWEFVSKGTEISLGRFVSEYTTSTCGGRALTSAICTDCKA
jgi:hypothetical protein